MIPRHDTRTTDGIGDRVQLQIDPIAPNHAIGDTLTVRARLWEDRHPVPNYVYDPGDESQISPDHIPNGYAHVWLFIAGPLDGDYGSTTPPEQRLVMSADQPGLFTRDWTFDKPGRFAMDVVAMGYMRDDAGPPAGYPYSRVFETTVQVGEETTGRTDAWSVIYLQHTGNRHFTAGLERIEPEGPAVAVSGLIMEPVLRQPVNFMVGRERLAADSSDGSIYCGHVANPQTPEHSIMHFTADGQRRQLPPPENLDIGGMTSLAVDGDNRRLWIGLPDRLVAVDLNTREVVRAVEQMAIQCLSADPVTGGVWAFAKPTNVPSAPDYTLRRFGPGQNSDLEVNQIRGSQRNFLHPLQSGSITCNAIYRQNHVLVQISRTGDVEQHGFQVGAPPQRKVVEMGVHTITGEPWVIHIEGGRTVLSQLDTGFNIRQTYGPDELDLHTMYSVDVNSQSDDVWLCGHQVVENPDPQGPDYIPVRTIQRRDASGVWHPLVSASLQYMALVRTFQ